MTFAPTPTADRVDRILALIDEVLVDAEAGLRLITGGGETTTSAAPALTLVRS